MYLSFSLLSYFPWLCVWAGCTIIFCQLFHLDPGKVGFLFASQHTLECAQIIGYFMAGMWYSFLCTLHYLIIFNTPIYLERRLPACQVYSVECMFNNQIYSLHYLYAVYGVECFGLPISLWMIVRIFVLHIVVIIKSVA